MKFTQKGEDLVDCVFLRSPYIHPIRGVPDQCGPNVPKDIAESVNEFYGGEDSTFEINYSAAFWCYKGPDRDASEHLHDPFAWPYFATEKHFKNFPPTYIVTNECDQLKDVAKRLYRQLIGAGVQAYLSEEAGSFHNGEIWDPLFFEIIQQRRLTFLKNVLQNKAKEDAKEG